MKEIGAPERVRWADFWSKAFQVLAEYRGIQHTKNMATIMISIRITRFLAMSLASDVLLRGRSVLTVAEVVRAESSIAEGFFGTWM